MDRQKQLKGHTDTINFSRDQSRILDIQRHRRHLSEIKSLRDLRTILSRIDNTLITLSYSIKSAEKQKNYFLKIKSKSEEILANLQRPKDLSQQKNI